MSKYFIGSSSPERRNTGDSKQVLSSNKKKNQANPITIEQSSDSQGQAEARELGVVGIDLIGSPNSRRNTPAFRKDRFNSKKAQRQFLAFEDQDAEQMNAIQRQSSHKYPEATPDHEKLSLTDQNITAMSVRNVDEDETEKSQSVSEQVIIKETTHGNSRIGAAMGSTGGDGNILTIAGAISKGDIKINPNANIKGQTGIDLMVADKVDIKDYNLDQISETGQELLIQEFIEWEKMTQATEGLNTSHIESQQELEPYREYRYYKRELLVEQKKKDKKVKKPTCATSCRQKCNSKSKLSTVNPNTNSQALDASDQKSRLDTIEDIDNINEKLNHYMRDDTRARKNWFKMKFRIQMIASFVKLSKWIQDEIEDEASEEEEEHENKAPWYIIRHETIGKNIWDMFTNVVYVSSFFLVLFVLAFDADELPDIRVGELLIDCIMLVDIISECCTTRQIEGKTLQSFSEIAPLYAKGSMPVDIIACLPGLITLEKFQPIYVLKLLRFIQISRTFTQCNEVITKLKHHFMQRSIIIGNTYTLIKTVFILLMIFHAFACFWIYIGSHEDGWRNNFIDYKEKDAMNIYITSMYFVTTTATTIGYGEFYGTTIVEKIFLMILEFTGILVFSSITGNIRTLKQPHKISQVIDAKVNEINYFMYQIDKTRPSQQLGDSIYDRTAKYINYSYHFGVANSFSKQFYKDLSVNLKNKLTFCVLRNYYDQIFYFFNDVKTFQYADQNFIRKILVSLDCQIYYHEETVIDIGQSFNFLYFNYNNTVQVVEWRKIFIISELPENSWFGDFNIFFGGLTSQYQYIATQSAQSEEVDTQVRLLVCPAEHLLSVCEEYPKMGQFLRKRALMRRNNFRLIESVLNKRFDVRRDGYDFLQAAANKRETKEQVQLHWQDKITKDNQACVTDPFTLEGMNAVADIDISDIQKEETVGFTPRNQTKLKAELQISTLCTQIKLQCANSVLNDATAALRQLDEDLNDVLFNPAGDLGKLSDIDSRRAVKDRIAHQRISILNIRKQNLCNMNLTLGSDEDDLSCLNDDALNESKSQKKRLKMHQVNKSQDIARIMQLVEQRRQKKAKEQQEYRSKNRGGTNKRLLFQSNSPVVTTMFSEDIDRALNNPIGMARHHTANPSGHASADNFIVQNGTEQMQQIQEEEVLVDDITDCGGIASHPHLPTVTIDDRDGGDKKQISGFLTNNDSPKDADFVVPPLPLTINNRQQQPKGPWVTSFEKEEPQPNTVIGLKRQQKIININSDDSLDGEQEPALTPVIIQSNSKKVDLRQDTNHTPESKNQTGGVSFLNETTNLKGLMDDKSFGGESDRQDVSQNVIQSSAFFNEVATKDQSRPKTSALKKSKIKAKDEPVKKESKEGAMNITTDPSKTRNTTMKTTKTEAIQSRSANVESPQLAQINSESGMEGKKRTNSKSVERKKKPATNGKKQTPGKADRKE